MENMKCRDNCKCIADLEKSLSDCEFELKYWKDQWELSEHKSRQKDRLILERNRNCLLIPMV